MNEAQKNAIREADNYLKAAGLMTYTQAAQQAARDREADRQRFRDPDFNRWLDEPITESGEFTAWHALSSTGDAFAGWSVRPNYTQQAAGQAGEVVAYACPDELELMKQRTVKHCLLSTFPAHGGKDVALYTRPAAVPHGWSIDGDAQPYIVATMPNGDKWHFDGNHTPGDTSWFAHQLLSAMLQAAKGEV